MEAKVVMDISQIDGTSSADIYPPNLSGCQMTTMDLNEAPFKIKEEHLIRLKALSRTGNSFFLSFFIIIEYIFATVSKFLLVFALLE